MKMRRATTPHHLSKGQLPTQPHGCGASGPCEGACKLVGHPDGMTQNRLHRYRRRVRKRRATSECRQKVVGHNFGHSFLFVIYYMWALH